MAEPTFLQKQLEGVEAKIQAEVGGFLQLRSRLTPFRSSADSATRERADQLYDRQVYLESQLESTMATIKEIKEGGVSGLLININNIYTLAGFVKDLKNQKDDVNQFIVAAKGEAPRYAGAGIFGDGAIPILALGALAAGAAYLWKGRK